MRFVLCIAGLAVLLWSAAPVDFEDRTSSSGIAFVLQNSATPEKHQIETMAGGVAVLDFDGDGLPDIFFTNGAPQPSLKKTGPVYSNRLYRNRGGFKFEDVTEKAGLAGTGFDIGAAAADYDNDGHVDLFVAGVRGNTLYRNRGDGTFEDVTARAGIHSNGWAVAAGWFDYDNDGRLDLFVVNYVRWDPATEPFCGDLKRSYRTYCHPQFYGALPNTLYHNNGDGTFTDVSVESGIAMHAGKGMGVAFADYDNDGRMDIFAGNDTVPSFLFHNEGNGHFREVGLRSGVAFNDDGHAVSAMGVDFRDLDNDGHDDLIVTALANESFPFYRNTGKGLFLDLTYASRIGAATLPLSGWGTGIFDFDNDGWKDIFAACGDVQDNTELFSSRHSRQPNLLLLNGRDGSFTPRSSAAPALHRGAAFADFDRDGRVDVVVTRIGERPLLLRNTMGEGNHWLNLRLVGHSSNRDGIGAQIHLVARSGEQWNHVTTAVGYASSSEPMVHFGLGADKEASRIEIRWPSGKTQILKNVPSDRYLAVDEP